VTAKCTSDLAEIALAMSCHMDADAPETACHGGLQAPQVLVGRMFARLGNCVEAFAAQAGLTRSAPIGLHRVRRSDATTPGKIGTCLQQAGEWSEEAKTSCGRYVGKPGETQEVAGSLEKGRRLAAVLGARAAAAHGTAAARCLSLPYEAMQFRSYVSQCIN
jgi:hypothetical protein